MAYRLRSSSRKPDCPYSSAKRKPTIGGGTRSLELTFSGFIHDLCSAIHPMAIASPFFRSLPLHAHGLEWIHPPLPFAHPFDNEPPAVLHRSIEQTASTLGRDGDAYKRFSIPWSAIGTRSYLRSSPRRFTCRRLPFAMARFGLNALRPAASLARATFKGHRAQGLFAGMAAHSIAPLEKPGTSAIGLVMAVSGHAGGWPLPKGGSQKIADALASYLRSLGGVIETDAPVDSIDSLPSARAVLFDTSPRQLVQIAGKRLPAGYKKRMSRVRLWSRSLQDRLGIVGPHSVDSSGMPPNRDLAPRSHTRGDSRRVKPTPGKEGIPNDLSSCSRSPACSMHTRAPAGRHTAWAYCHVPHGSTTDMTQIIENQVERSAPGFRDVILARSTKNTVQMEQSNANLIGGDIAGGANNLQQILFRPVAALDPYRTPAEGLYICSASTPPGGGVHGMCGYNAARSALKHTFGR